MEQWETERGRGSDEMSAILEEAFRDIGLLPDIYTLPDLADAIEFASRGTLVVELHEKAPGKDTWKPYHGWKEGEGNHLSLAVVLHSAGGFKTIPNRGQVKCKGSAGIKESP